MNSTAWIGSRKFEGGKVKCVKLSKEEVTGVVCMSGSREIEKTECVCIMNRKCILVPKISTLVTGQGTDSTQIQSQKFTSGSSRELVHLTYFVEAMQHQQNYLGETQAGCAANTNHCLLPSAPFYLIVPPPLQLFQKLQP